MSTAVFAQGMRPFAASGYANKSTFLNQQYIPWKGTGPLANPVGTAASHIRPLTNLDPGNVFPTGFGLPRPIKHYRKGRVIPVPALTAADVGDETPARELELINYNLNRFVKSSKGTSLGGGFGGSGLLNEMQDKPGAYIVHQNPISEINESSQADRDCRTCEGVAVVASYYPNTTYLTENPEPNVCNPILCCNEERKARRRAIYASSNLKKNYYTSSLQYIQNRCKTYEQKAFNFKQLDRTQTTATPFPVTAVGTEKPGSPIALAQANTYLANCYPNVPVYEAVILQIIGQTLSILLNRGIITQQQYDSLVNTSPLITTLQGLWDALAALEPPETAQAALRTYSAILVNPAITGAIGAPSNPVGCEVTTYKPNNYQFAQQGAVSSSTRTLKRMVDTISTNAASIQDNNNTGQALINAGEIQQGVPPNVANLLKNKAPTCNHPTPFPFQNKKRCYYQRQMPDYQMSKSQPSPYRYYMGTVFNTNHFSQSPNTYNTTSGSAAY